LNTVRVWLAVAAFVLLLVGTHAAECQAYNLVRVHAGGLVSFELDTSATDTVVFASPEAADPNVRPQLIVAFHDRCAVAPIGHRP
jgi:hypothetical protein